MTQCQNCSFYQEKNKERGACRRNSPTFWAVVNPNDWCGEWVQDPGKKMPVEKLINLLETMAREVAYGDASGKPTCFDMVRIIDTWRNQKMTT